MQTNTEQVGKPVFDGKAIFLLRQFSNQYFPTDSWSNRLYKFKNTAQFPISGYFADRQPTKLKQVIKSFVNEPQRLCNLWSPDYFRESKDAQLTFYDQPERLGPTTGY